MPVQPALGKGAAFNASVSSTSHISQLEDAALAAELALAEARAAEKAQRPYQLVERMKRKVAKFRANLEEAEHNLADAIAALPKEN
jgi:hypothetical protein